MDDMDIDNTPLQAYCYKISNSNDIIDLPQVRAWLENLYRESPRHPEEMNRIGKQTLDFKVKMKQLAEFILNRK